MPAGCRACREWSQVKDDEIRARFDGRGRVERMPGHATGPRRQRIEDMARALGYRLLSVENLGGLGIRLVYEHDFPLARRRNELSLARLRAGGPLLPAVEPPPPRLRPPRRNAPCGSWWWGRGAGLLWNPWFLVGGLAFGLAARNFERATTPRRRRNAEPGREPSYERGRGGGRAGHAPGRRSAWRGRKGPPVAPPIRRSHGPGQGSAG